MIPSRRLAAVALSLAFAICGAPAMGQTVGETDGVQFCAIDVQQVRLRAFYTDDAGDRFESVTALEGWLGATHERILCATNGGIFAPGGKPLGWFVADGVALVPVNTEARRSGNFFLQPNGAFLIAHGQARILPTAALIEGVQGDVAGIDVGVQSGPLLVIDGRINARLNPDSTSSYSRNAVCTRDARTVLLAYSAEPVSLYSFARTLVKLGCQDALYLDGHLSQFVPDRESPPIGKRQPLSVILAVTTKDPA